MPLRLLLNPKELCMFLDLLLPYVTNVPPHIVNVIPNANIAAIAFFILFLLL